jgi:hypothetical protein
MGVVLIFTMLVLLAFLNAGIIRLLRRRGAGRHWWCALAIAWSAGAGSGVWSGCFFEYQPTPELRVLSAPVPTAFFHWEGPLGEEQWVDYITPVPELIAGSDIAFIALLAGLPVGLVFLLRR